MLDFIIGLLFGLWFGLLIHLLIISEREKRLMAEKEKQWEANNEHEY